MELWRIRAACVDKLESMSIVLKEVLPKLDRLRKPETRDKESDNKESKAGKENQADDSGIAKPAEKTEGKDTSRTDDKADTDAKEAVDITVMEKARPVASATYAVEKPEELVIGEPYTGSLIY